MRVDRRNMMAVWAALAMTTPVAAVAGTPQDPAALQREKMAEALFLVGDWTGTGWIDRGGVRHFDQTEKVSAKLGGLVVLFEGRGRDAESGALAHEALALLSYDPTADGFAFRSYVASGQVGDFPAEVSDGQFTWSIPLPQGQLRYRITLTPAGQWHEVGERESADGNWTQFFEMTLTRDAP